MDHIKLLAACKRARVSSVGGSEYINRRLIDKYTVAADISNVKYRIKLGYIPDNLNEMVRKETTYDNCFHWGVLLITQSEGNVDAILTITIMNGDMMYGQPTDQRCSYDIIMDMNKPGHKHLFDKLIAHRLEVELKFRASCEQTNREEVRAQAEANLIYQEYFEAL